MTWNLFLDDERYPTHVDPTLDRQWIVARSTEEAIQEVTHRGFPWFMSLDHDLGSNDTTMDFLRWLVWEYGGSVVSPPQYQIHSANPVGAKNIEAFMNSWKRVAEMED